MNSKPFYYSFLSFLVVLFIGLVVLMCTSSCNITKGKKTLSVDSTRTNKVDSGSVKKSQSTEKTTGGYERQTLIYYRDTGISSKPSPSAFDYSRLAAVISERGNYQQEKQKNTSDSSWKRSYDSLKLMFKESLKNKEEKPTPILIKIVGAVVLFLVAAAAIKYVIKK